MPEKDKKKDELTLDTTSPPPPPRHRLEVLLRPRPRRSTRPRSRSARLSPCTAAIRRLAVSRRPGRTPRCVSQRPRSSIRGSPRAPPDATRPSSLSNPFPSRHSCARRLRVALTLSFLSSRRSGSACRTSTTSVRTACARRGLSSRRGVPSRSSPPSTSTPARGTSFALTRAAPANVRVQRDRVEPDPGSESPPGDEQAPSTSKTNATRIDSGSSRRRGLKLSTPAEDEWRRVAVALDPDALADAPRLDSPSSPWNRLAWRDVTGAGADVQLRDVVLESWSAIEPRDGSNPASDTTRGSVDDATNDTSSASTTDFPSARPRAPRAIARVHGGGARRCPRRRRIDSLDGCHYRHPAFVFAAVSARGSLERRRRGVSRAGRPSPAGFSSRRSSPPWPRSSRFSSSPSRAPDALARVRNDDADDRSRRTRRSPRRFLVEVEVANAPRHRSSVDVEAPGDVSGDAAFAWRPPRAPASSSRATSGPTTPARVVERALSRSGSGAAFHRAAAAMGGAGARTNSPPPRGCETRRTRTISRLRTNPATTAAISAARRAGIRSAA